MPVAGLEQALRQRIEFLRAKLQALVSLEPPITTAAGRDGLEAEKRAVRMALMHYQAALDMEEVIQELEALRKKSVN